MRRPRFVLTSALAAVGLAALPSLAQQPSRAVSPAGASSSPAADSSADPFMAGRPARYLLQNGLDYLNYREYDRALNFFRGVEGRQAELTDAERQKLRQGIARAQQGKREAVNGPHVVANPKGRPTDPPGSFALAKPAAAPTAIASARPAAARRPMAAEPVQLTSGTMAAPEPAPNPAAAPSPAVVVASEPAPLDLPPAAAVAPTPIGAVELPTLPGAPPEALPDLTTPPPGAAPMPIAADPAPMPVLPDPILASTPELAPSPATAAEPAAAPELPTLGAPMPDPAETPSAPPAELPTLPQVEAPAPEAAPAPAPAVDTPPAPTQLPTQDPATIPAQAQPDSPPQSAPEPPPAPEASTLPTGGEPVGADPDMPVSRVGANSHIGSLLTPDDHEAIARIAQRTTENPAGERASAANPTNDPNGATGPVQGSTRLELQRAPSPTEARPIRRIAVPEEFVPLGRRDWTPNRKYWAAAGTCHMILYFQDPVLERYGQGVEQALGPRGRYFSYPLDDPKQSNQRNQILQPFWSIGKFCFQVGTLPYKLVVDPPWEAEYDLGYYRPGDKVPTDTIMITPTGIGPPLKGRKY